MTNTLTELKEGLDSLQDRPSFDEQFKDLQAALIQEHDQLTEMRADVHRRVNAFFKELDGQIASIEEKLSIFGTKTKKKSSPERTTKPKPSAASITRVLTYLDGEEESRSYDEIAEALGVNVSTVNHIVQEARRHDLVLLTNRGGETGRKLFFSLAPGAMDRVNEGSIQWQ